MSSIDDKLNSVSEDQVCGWLDYLCKLRLLSAIGALLDEEDQEDMQVDHNDTGVWPAEAIFTPPFLRERDLPDGARLRMRAHREAWETCRKSVQEAIRGLHRPVTERVLAAVRAAYKQEEPLMAGTELPTVVISGADRSATAAVVSDVERSLRVWVDDDDDDDDAMAMAMAEDGAGCANGTYVSAIAAGDCASMSSAMKALIGGFTRWDPEDGAEGDRAQTHPSASVLAPFDMNVLEAWFRAVQDARSDDVSLKLVVLVREFENIDPAVMQDVFYICSLHIPRLPLVFILSCASPSQISFLHVAYPRTTLTLLGLTRVDVKSGPDALERVLQKVFFDPRHEPTIIPSPGTLSFIVEQFSRTSLSLDLILMILKLVYLRHFSEPLTVLANGELNGETLGQQSSRPFLDALLSRLHHPEKSKTFRPYGMEVDEGSPSTTKKRKERADPGWRVTTIDEVLQHIREAREAHQRRSAGTRTAFQVFLLVRNYILDNGFQSLLDSGGRKGETTVCVMMVHCLRGTLAARDGRSVAAAIRKLPVEHLSALLSEIYGFVHSLPTGLRSEEGGTMAKLVGWNTCIDSSPDDIHEVRKEVEEWFLEYLNERMRDYTEANLWDVWYTKNPDGIKELFDPAPRASVISALVHPDRYLGPGPGPGPTPTPTSTPTPTPTPSAAAPAPDTCVLFQRYLESGRMVNVYDWFGAFAAALAAQRRRSREQAQAQAQRRKRKSAAGRSARRTRDGRTRGRRGGAPGSAAKRGRGGRGRGRGRGGEASAATAAAARRLGAEAPSGVSAASASDSGDESDEHEHEGEDEDEDEETWKLEIQARFLRAVQELDFMGFIKHTKRKADHVHKTVYDLPEYVE